ncbi:MAG: DNA cytosine methyltransferase [Flavobacteriales bacterium]|nr:DNA cytosine methyltransferase [Flavobacteriales bacterium]
MKSSRTNKQKRLIPTLSLFSGAGGLDLGFLQAGFDIRGCVEIVPAYAATLCENLHGGDGYQHGTTVHCEDIRKFDTRPYRQMGIECIIGGPPCQTFSAAGRRSGGVIGTEDERGQLFNAYCRVLRELNPRVFVFENVYGLPGANGGGPWREIIAAFSKLGYKLHAEVVDAADYGVPQHRERLIMVGSKEGSFEFPLPTHGPDSFGGPPLVSVEEAIRDLQAPKEPYHDDLGGLYGHLLPFVPEGLNYSFFTAEMGHPEPVFAWRSKFHDLLYKVNRNEPCRTIKAQPGKFTGPFHWKNRHFTVPELRRLQTFPDSYNLVGSYGKVVEQIGNSVPPRLAYVIAASVREQILEPTKQLKFKTRPLGFQSTFRVRQRLRTHHFNDVARKAIVQQYGAKKVVAINKAEKDAGAYLLNPTGLFDRRKIATRKEAVAKHPLYEVRVRERGSHVDLQFDSIGAEANGSVCIEMTGLRKYLPNFDTLTLHGKVDKAQDVFHAWTAIEQSLVQRSRFFSLIDIYGHYANRGDTVRVSSTWVLSENEALVKALNFFGDSLKCGDFAESTMLSRQIGVRKDSLEKLIATLRKIRFDVRSSKTHPIIGDCRVLCTYPFPLLSPRALVESRVRLNSEGEMTDLELAL